MNSSLHRATNWSLRAVLALIAFAAFGPIGLLAGAINPTGMSNMLGVSYPVINATTVTNLTDQTSKVQREAWVRRIIFGADRLYQDNPFADNLSGQPGSGKAVTSITDTEKLAGTTVNIPTVAGFGGPGVAGEGNRIGAEQKIRVGNFQVKIGVFWFGVGFTAVARDQTVIGGPLDMMISEGLREQLAKKKSDDIMMRLIQRGSGFRNILRPDGVASVADLNSTHVLNTSLISKGGTMLSSLGGKPMNTSKDASGSRHERFVLLETHLATTPLDTEGAYLDARLNAGVRGDGNAIWNGVYDDWLGHGIYRWHQRDHANFGPVGSPLLARAFLGVAITNATTSTEVKGGGSAAAAAVTPAPLYFQFFRNAPYTFFSNTDNIAAITDVTRHIIIINTDGSYGVFPYLLNDGNKITISGAQISIGVGTETDDFAIGALIHECNIQGQVWGRGIYLAQDAIVCGAGSINGNKADPMMGKRTEEHRNHDMDHGIGIEAVWGCEAVKRPDDVYPNFLITEHAVPIPGAPIIEA